MAIRIGDTQIHIPVFVSIV